MYTKDCLIELKHIQLELEHGRNRNMRHFVDQYYCYKHGYVTKGGSPKWDLIFFHDNEVISPNAKKLKLENLKLTKELKNKVVKEHVVPLNIIIKELQRRYEPGVSSLDAIAECIDEYLIFATITKEEDARLREQKLQSKMPEGFYDPGHQLHNNLFARYIESCIEYDVPASKSQHNQR